MFKSVRRFIGGIEVPGASRPHPWVSPLHLACRFGQAAIAAMLIRRGAAVNGGGAAAFAPKSPLEEALSYARANCQAYSIFGDQRNYRDVRDDAHLDNSSAEAMADQRCQLDSFLWSLREKARIIAAQETAEKRSKDPEASEVDPDWVYTRCMTGLQYQPNSLALFGFYDLEGVAVPSMSTKVLVKATVSHLASLVHWIDPIKGPIKAVCLAAKIVIKILLEMMKRPIAHYDPALQAAHVMMFFRAPLNTSEKQTSIFLRDMVANASYDYLALDHQVIQDAVWKQSAVEKINAIKTNNEFGFKVIDMTPDPGVFKKAKRAFEGAVESTFYTTAVSAVLPAYYLPKLVEHLSGRGSDGKPRPIRNLAELHGAVSRMIYDSLLNEMTMEMEKVIQ